MAETPEEMRTRLLKQLSQRRPDIEKLYRYYTGDHPLPWAPAQVKDAYRAFLKMSRANLCRRVVKAPAERLRPVGLKFSSGDLNADVAAWERYWQGNRLDRDHRLVHDAALVARRSFVLVWPAEDDDDMGIPSITPEHPSQVIVDYEPGERSCRRAALKWFVDRECGMQFSTLWTPDAVYNWSATLSGGSNAAWSPWMDPEENITPEADNPFGKVPVVEFQADPTLCDEPMGELDGGVTDIQDRIDKTILDRLVTSNFTSFPQRWVTGLEIPVDPETGEDLEPFEAAVDRIWHAENPDAKFGEFSIASLTPYLEAVRSDIEMLAATSGTPLHDLLGPSAQPPSAESLKAAEAPLIAKVGERRDSFTESWEEVLRLALQADNDPRADDMALSVLWKNPELRTQAETMDAATKMAAVGVPWSEIMAFIGYTPTEIARLRDERDADMLTQGIASGAVAPPTNPRP